MVSGGVEYETLNMKGRNLFDVIDMYIYIYKQLNT